MIRIGEKLQVHLLHPDEATAREWEQDLAAADCSIQPLLIETVSSEWKPRCPACLAAYDQWEVQGRCGVLLCLLCQVPFVVMAYSAIKGVPRFLTFPWGKKGDR